LTENFRDWKANLIMEVLMHILLSPAQEENLILTSLMVRMESRGLTDYQVAIMNPI